MAKYRITAIFKGWKDLGVFEADSLEEAEELAYDSEESSPNLCYHCANQVHDLEVDDLFIEEDE